MDALIPDAHRMKHGMLDQHVDIETCSVPVRYVESTDHRTLLSHPDFEDATKELGYTDPIDVGVFRRYLESVARFGEMVLPNLEKIPVPSLGIFKRLFLVFCSILGKRSNN